MRPDRRPPTYPRRLQLPIAWPQQLAGIGGRAGKSVIGEYHAVPNEHIVFDNHAFANKGVARYLAPATDPGVLLDFYERADFTFVADFATIQVNEF